MATEREYQQRLDQFATLLRTVAEQLGSATVSDPTIADTLIRDIDAQMAAWEGADRAVAPPPDLGVAQLTGVGPYAAPLLGDTRIPQGVKAYDDEVSSERIIAVGDLYYIFQHERIGVFRVVTKLQELFRAGAIRLSSGEGAYGLYNGIGARCFDTPRGSDALRTVGHSGTGARQCHLDHARTPSSIRFSCNL